MALTKALSLKGHLSHTQLKLKVIVLFFFSMNFCIFVNLIGLYKYSNNNNIVIHIYKYYFSYRLVGTTKHSVVNGWTVTLNTLLTFL